MSQRVDELDRVVTQPSGAVPESDNTVPAEKAVGVPGAPLRPVTEVETNRTTPPSDRHAEAGRKGARRVHQLIQSGKLYEREHGLKPGRQRLRQLIQEGKLYEREHGLSPGGKRSRGDLARLSGPQALEMFLRLFTRLVKPAHRARLLEVLRGLEENPARKAG